MKSSFAGLAIIVGLIATSAQHAEAGCVTGVSPGKGLHVRSGPGLSYGIKGHIPADACGVRVTSRCRKNWCRVSYKGLRGWSIMKFIDRDRVGTVSSGAVTPIAADQPVATSRWELLGARSVDGSRDRDTIPVTRAEGRFDAMQIVVRDYRTFIRDVTVTFGNGTTQVIPINSLFTQNQRTSVLDLTGGNRFIRSIDVRYKIRPGATGLAEVLFFGRHHGGPAGTAQPATSTGALEWELLGSRSVQFRTDTDIIPVGRSVGSFRAIQLAVRNNELMLQSLRVVYGNGRVQDIAVKTVIPSGGTTRIIDLRGGDRFIKNIEMTYRSTGPRNLTAKVEVYGLQ